MLFLHVFHLVRPVATCEALDEFVENRNLQFLPNCSRDDACTAVTCYNEDKDNRITICEIRFSCARPSLGLTFINSEGVTTLDRTITVDAVVPVSEQAGDLDVKLESKDDSFIVSVCVTNKNPVIISHYYNIYIYIIISVKDGSFIDVTLFQF